MLCPTRQSSHNDLLYSHNGINWTLLLFQDKHPAEFLRKNPVANYTREMWKEEVV